MWVPCLSPALTLQLGALVALALAPGGTDAPAAVLLLGEAWQGIAAALGGGGWTESQGAQPPPSLPPHPADPPVLSNPLGLAQGSLRE